MIENLKPNQPVTLRVKTRPTNAAARKTIVRLLSKDPEVARENERQRRVREKHVKIKQRGGRMWHSRVVKQRPVTGEVGESGRINATLDVIRDLSSVERFVEVSA